MTQQFIAIISTLEMIYSDNFKSWVEIHSVYETEYIFVPIINNNKYHMLFEVEYIHGFSHIQQPAAALKTSAFLRTPLIHRPVDTGPPGVSCRLSHGLPGLSLFQHILQVHDYCCCWSCSTTHSWAVFVAWSVLISAKLCSHRPQPSQCASWRS